MTPEERQALREKHRKDEWGDCSACSFDCDDTYYSFSVVYPCDVIKVLDELDKTWKGLDVLADAGLAAVGAFNELRSQPCPKCGEKL